MQDSDLKNRFGGCGKLWSTILNCNKCDIKTTNTSEYFIPEQEFDYIWAHEFLASKCFDDYSPPTVFQCKQEPATATERQVVREEEIEQMPYRGSQADIVPLDKQIAIIEEDVEIRKKLANDFANRKYPWYIQRPSYMLDFVITDEIKKLFKDPFEYDILKNIQHFKCHVMIIDVAPDIPLRYLERWLKFSSYAVLITVIHDTELYDKLRNFKCVFEPVLTEEDEECSWHKELNRSIQKGVQRAQELSLIDDASKPIIFVFSRNRNICVCDEFKILRRT